MDFSVLKSHFILVFTMDDVTEPYINKGVVLQILSDGYDGQVMFAVTTCDASAVNALDEHPFGLALHGFEILDFVLQRDLSHGFTAFGFHLFGYLVGHCGGFGACAHRVFERVYMAEADFLSEIAALLEGQFIFVWEAHDDVGGEVEVGTEGLDTLAHVAELADSVMTVHSLQGVIGAALQADVHVGSQLLVLEQGQEAVAELVRLDGGDAHAEVAFDGQDVFHKLLKVSAFVLVAAHIYTCQHDFLEAVADDFAHIVVDILSGAARRPSAHHWDDAVGAEVVAPIVDLDEASGVEGVESWLVAEEVAVVAFGVAVACVEMLVDDVE